MRHLRIISPFAVLLSLGLVLTGCGSDDTDDKNGSAKSDVRAGLVTDVGGLNDKSFNAQANKGLEQAEEELGIKGNVLESKAATDYDSNLGKFASDGYDLVTGVGFLMSDSVLNAAKASPDTNFSIIDFSYGDKTPKNVRGLVFKEQEAGYLAGALAGMAEDESKLDGLNDKKVVSAIGGQKIPPVDKFIAGYKAGVMAYCKDCKVLVGYSQDFVAQDKCKELAINHIDQGADIVFQVAGGCGLGALDAAKSAKVWGIGVDADQSFLGDHILTSAIKRVDQAVFDTIKAVDDDEFVGGEDGVYGFKEDGVGLGKIAAPAEDAYGDMLKEVEDKVRAGEIEIPETVA